MYVIQRREDGKYVAASGSLHSYTRKLEEAQRFYTRDSAAPCCENERIVPLDSLFHAPALGL